MGPQRAFSTRNLLVDGRFLSELRRAAPWPGSRGSGNMDELAAAAAVEATSVLNADNDELMPDVTDGSVAVGLLPFRVGTKAAVSERKRVMRAVATPSQ